MPRLHKRVKVAYPCRVCSHDCTMEQESIQCDGCQCWLHQHCIQMTTTQYVHFSAPHLQFYCRQCLFCSDGTYNFSAALSRIAVLSPDVSLMQLRADSELNILQFYQAMLPTVSSVTSSDAPLHKQSVALLQDHKPWLLDRYSPADVAGDGNCLFRAVSVALYGRETMHSHLRLLSAIEALMNSAFYDQHSASYYAPYKADECLVLTDYQAFVSDIVQNGAFSDMHTVLALSSVIQKPIQTHWPIVLRDAWTSPLTKLVAGRDVNTTHAINILWSIGTHKYPGKGKTLKFDHFVPIRGRLSVPSSVPSSEATDRRTVCRSAGS